MADNNSGWQSSVFDTTGPLKNTVFRVIGRNLGAWAWKMAESGTAILMPWVMAGGFARNTDPTLSAMQNTFRDYADRFTNFRPVCWVKNIYQGVDGRVSRVLSFSDRTINRLNFFPGFQLLTGFPLFLGNWDQKYKQMKNFVVLRALWNYGVQPVLKRQLWTPYAKVASIYVAPYADAALRVWDQNLSQILGENYKGGESFSLSTLQNSCASGWKDANFMWRGLNYILCGGGATTLNNENHQVFNGVKLTTAGIEKLAENHMESLKWSAEQIATAFNSGNQYATQAIGYVDEMGSTVMNFGLNFLNNLMVGTSNYHNCLTATDKGFKLCTQQTASNAWSGYVQPTFNATYNFILENAQYVWENGLKDAIAKAGETCQLYVIPGAALAVGGAGLMIIGYRAWQARSGAPVVGAVVNNNIFLSHPLAAAAAAVGTAIAGTAVAIAASRP
jgi:hypothetical protein